MVHNFQSLTAAISVRSPQGHALVVRDQISITLEHHVALCRVTASLTQGMPAGPYWLASLQNNNIAIPLVLGNNAVKIGEWGSVGFDVQLALSVADRVTER